MKHKLSCPFLFSTNPNKRDSGQNSMITIPLTDQSVFSPGMGSINSEICDNNINQALHKEKSSSLLGNYAATGITHATMYNQCYKQFNQSFQCGENNIRNNSDGHTNYNKRMNDPSNSDRNKGEGCNYITQSDQLKGIHQINLNESNIESQNTWRQNVQNIIANDSGNEGSNSDVKCNYVNLEDGETQSIQNKPDIQLRESYEDKENYRGLVNNELRLGFVKKVLNTLFKQFIILIVCVTPSVFSLNYREFQSHFKSIIYFAISWQIITMMLILHCRQICRKVPYNYILLLMFSLTTGYLLSLFSGMFEPLLVLFSVFYLTIYVFILLVYVTITASNITQKLPSILYFVLTLFHLSIFGIYVDDQIDTFFFIVTFIGIFASYLVFNIQQIQEGKTYVYAYGDNIIAALDIYYTLFCVQSQ